MGEADGGTFQCAACGRGFRWKPELAGKKAKCKCGATVTVPAQAPPAPAPPAASDDAGSYDSGSGIRAPQQPRPAPQSQQKPRPRVQLPADLAYTPPPRRAPAMPAPAVPAAPPPPAQIGCPVCGAPALPTAILCQNCGYNFRTGMPGRGGGRVAAVRHDAGGGISADTYAQAAKAAWVAPLLAFAMGCCTRGASGAVPAAGFVIAGFQLLLILGGTGLGIFALFGVRRHGPERILLPAISGLVLNGIIIVLNVILFTMLFSGKLPFGPKPPRGTGTAGTGAAAPAPRTPRQAQQQAEDAFLGDPGWFGVLQHRGATITLVSVADASALAADLQSNLGTPVSILVLGVDNSTGGDGFAIDPAGGTVHFIDGTSQSLPDVAAVLRSARSDPQQAVRAFAPPFTVNPGRQLTGKFVFVPPGTDPKTIQRVTLKIDGRDVDIPGQYLTADEKRALHEAGTQR